MTAELSLKEIVARLEAQIAFHRKQEAFHAEQEVAHRERRGAHAAELEVLTRNLEALQSAASTVVELASRPEAAALRAPEPFKDLGRRLTLPRMVERVVAEKPVGQPFGTNEITAAVNRRFPQALRKPVTPRLVSITLRRMLDAGKLRGVRPGKPYHEALFARE
jgi:hypothetical protein